MVTRTQRGRTIYEAYHQGKKTYLSADPKVAKQKFEAFVAKVDADRAATRKSTNERLSRRITEDDDDVSFSITRDQGAAYGAEQAGADVYGGGDPRVLPAGGSPDPGARRADAGRPGEGRPAVPGRPPEGWGEQAATREFRVGDRYVARIGNVTTGRDGTRSWFVKVYEPSAKAVLSDSD